MTLDPLTIEPLASCESIFPSTTADLWRWMIESLIHGQSMSSTYRVPGERRVGDENFTSWPHNELEHVLR